MAQSYPSMLIESNEVPMQFNLAAAAAFWMMLAGLFHFTWHVHCAGTVVLSELFSPGRPRPAGRTKRAASTTF